MLQDLLNPCCSLYLIGSWHTLTSNAHFRICNSHVDHGLRYELVSGDKADQFVHFPGTIVAHCLSNRIGFKSNKESLQVWASWLIIVQLYHWTQSFYSYLMPLVQLRKFNKWMAFVGLLFTICISVSLRLGTECSLNHKHSGSPLIVICVKMPWNYLMKDPFLSELERIVNNRRAGLFFAMQSTYFSLSHMFNLGIFGYDCGRWV